MPAKAGIQLYTQAQSGEIALPPCGIPFAAGGSRLDRRTFDRTKGTKNAAIAGAGTQQRLAAAALI